MSRFNRKGKFIVSDIDEIPYNTWKVFITIRNTQILNQIIDILKRKGHWAFVWCEWNLSEHNYSIYECTMLPTPKIEIGLT
jgi:hypothetical protein